MTSCHKGVELLSLLKTANVLSCLFEFRNLLETHVRLLSRFFSFGGKHYFYFIIFSTEFPSHLIVDSMREEKVVVPLLFWSLLVSSYLVLFPDSLGCVLGDGSKHPWPIVPRFVIESGQKCAYLI